MALHFTAKEAREVAYVLSLACGDECRFGCRNCRNAHKLWADLKILHASHARIKRLEKHVKELRKTLDLKV